MAPKACDICYRKKILCSIPGAEEPCNWCKHHKLACTFTRTARGKTRNRVKLRDVEELQNRIKQLEGALIQSHAHHPLNSEGSTTAAVEHDDPPQPEPSSGSETSPASNGFDSTGSTVFSPLTNHHRTNFPFDQNKVSGSQLGQNWYHKGMPILSETGEKWISSKTGEDVSFARLKIFDSQARLCPSALQLHISHQELWELPPKTTTQTLVDVFFRSPFQLDFPVLDKVLFEKTIEVAYGNIDITPLSLSSVLARACVLAALSVMCRLEESKEGPPKVDGDICAIKAQYLLGHVNGDASLENLQTLLMLQKHQTSTGQTQNATLLHAAACRIVCSLGGNAYKPLGSYGPEISLSDRRGHHVRRLFWLCYFLDKDISLLSGHPPLLAEPYCDLTLPETFTSCYAIMTDWNEELGACDSVYERLIPCIPGDPHLSYLKEKTCRLLFSPQAFNITDAQLLLRIRQLDDELEKWRLSIPFELRPVLSIPPTHPLLSAERKHPQRTRYAILQLEYHYMTTVIHTTVRRCGAGNAETEEMPEDLHSVIHSSVDLSLEASRSTMLLLKVSVTTLAKDAPFCHPVFYLTVAAMSLFTNILIHPHSAKTQLDVELLGSAISIIQSLPVRTLTDGDVKHMQEMTEFLVELVRLGSCALWKTKREGKHMLD